MITESPSCNFNSSLRSELQNGQELMVPSHEEAGVISGEDPAVVPFRSMDIAVIILLQAGVRVLNPHYPLERELAQGEDGEVLTACLTARSKLLDGRIEVGSAVLNRPGGVPHPEELVIRGAAAEDVVDAEGVALHPGPGEGGP
jgi:hypothetical protein